MNGPSDAVTAAIASNKTEIPKDKLEKIQTKAREARDIEFQIENLMSQVSEKKLTLNNIYTIQLPEMMQEAKIDTIGIPKEGNYQGWDYNLEKYYRANIAAGWPEEKRELGFEFVKSMGADGLIKTEVVVYFPQGSSKFAKELVAMAKKLQKKIKPPKGKKVAPKLHVEVSRSIPHKSLTAWLRELVEKHKKVPSASDLEKIGGSIGVIVKPEERKE